MDGPWPRPDGRTPLAVVRWCLQDFHKILNVTGAYFDYSDSGSVYYNPSNVVTFSASAVSGSPPPPPPARPAALPRPLTELTRRPSVFLLPLHPSLRTRRCWAVLSGSSTSPPSSTWRSRPASPTAPSRGWVSQPASRQPTQPPPTHSQSACLPSVPLTPFVPLRDPHRMRQ